MKAIDRERKRERQREKKRIERQRKQVQAQLRQHERTRGNAVSVLMSCGLVGKRCKGRVSAHEAAKVVTERGKKLTGNSHVP